MAVIPYILITLLIGFILVFFALYWRDQMPRKGTPEWIVYEKSKRKMQLFTRHKMTKRDWLCMAAVTAVFAVVSFLYLGDTGAPQSVYRLEQDVTLEITLDEPVELSRIQYYTGLNLKPHEVGKMTLLISPDGENWDTSKELSHKYSETFRWRELSLDGVTVKALRIELLKSACDIGEIALWDMYGHIIPAERITVVSDKTADENMAERPELYAASNLIDEQSIVSGRRSIMNGTHFDEIYHAYTAYEYIEGLYPYENTHPPLGKEITMLGIKIFGMTPFGWRVMPALFGVLMLPFLYVLIANMFGKTIVSLCGTVIFAFDFMHFVQTRISTIDVYAVFFIICMYFFMYRWMTMEREKSFIRTLPNLALCGLSFGLGAASKWVCLYAALGLVVLYVWGLWRRYQDDRKRSLPFSGHLTKTLLCSVLFFAIIPSMIYLASYIPYAAGTDLTLENIWKRCWSNQKTMLNYHGTLGDVNAKKAGTVETVHVTKGQTVTAGDLLVTIRDSEGTSVNITATHDGTVKKLLAKTGKSVAAGSPVANIGGHAFESRWYEWLIDKRPVFYFIETYSIIPDFAAGTESHFELDGTRLVRYTGPGGDVVLPQVKSIAGDAFSYAVGGINRIYLPAGLHTFEDGALTDIGGAVVYVPRDSSAHRYVYDQEISFSLYADMRMSASTFNNPLVSWGGFFALLSTLFLLLYRKRQIAMFILIGYFAQLVPWLAIDRTTYAYHYFPSMVFLVLALCFVFDSWLDRAAVLSDRAAAPGKPPLLEPRRSPAKKMIIAFTVITVVLFAMFYPVLAAYPVSGQYVKYFLRWFSSWPV